MELHQVLSGSSLSEADTSQLQLINMIQQTQIVKHLDLETHTIYRITILEMI
jgi:hypothetical protein